MEFTHFDDNGNARMVEVSDKKITKRVAIARGRIYTSEEVIKKIEEGKVEKGDVLGVARVAGIMGSKKTSDLIPMCHPLMITGIDIHFSINNKDNYIESEARVKTVGKTGVEIEAITSCSISLITIYDMCKSLDREMEISNIRLISKSGGKSGSFNRGA